MEKIDRQSSSATRNLGSEESVNEKSKPDANYAALEPQAEAIHRDPFTHNPLVSWLIQHFKAFNPMLLVISTK
jgi:hypothetical protein